MHEQKPWLKFYGHVPESIAYPRVTLYQALRATAEKNPSAIATDFFGKTRSYEQLMAAIDQCARALYALGLRRGDRITISMPTSPQGIACFYAANKLGAVSSMIHPLSPAKEVAFYLKVSKSRMALTLDAFYPVFAEAMREQPIETLILARIPDELPFPLNVLFSLTKGRKIKKVPPDPRVRFWKPLMAAAFPEPPPNDMQTDDLASILYSGGTTGTPKGIMLSNMNFISQGMMSAAWGKIGGADSMLAILPIFHGFGLGVCVNAVLMGGGKSILVPTFTAETVAKLIRKKRPSFIVGVPTLYEALTRNADFLRADLRCLRGAFCGADRLPRAVKEAFEDICRRSGADIKLLEGYGLTEAVTAIMCMPVTGYREGSIGIPFPDMLAKVVKIGTTEEAALGEEGEICVSGPAVMLGYLDQPEETANTLRRHADGRVWLHTGDIATMDADGYFYFKLRLKRMIKSSGMNVYPSQVEEVLCRHPDVVQACVIGVPDQAQVERVKAFVVLRDPAAAGPAMQEKLIAHCREHLIKWSCPREIEFRCELPCTRIGKIDFRKLTDEEIAKIKACKEQQA
jgi:long-chain acyl-CoA synthetase